MSLLRLLVDATFCGEEGGGVDHGCYYLRALGCDGEMMMYSLSRGVIEVERGQCVAGRAVDDRHERETLRRK